MMHPRDRHAAEQRSAQRVEHRDEPEVPLATIHPDKHMSTRFDGAYHLMQRARRMFEMMDDADREGDVETLGERKIVGARPHHLDRGEGREVAPCLRQGTLVDIDRAPLPGPVLHGPKAVAAHAAADVEKALAAPLTGCEMHRPTPELL